MSWGGQGEERGRGKVSRCKGWKEKRQREREAICCPIACPVPSSLACQSTSYGDGGAAAAYIKKIRPALSSRDAVCCLLSHSLGDTIQGYRELYLVSRDYFSYSRRSIHVRNRCIRTLAGSLAFFLLLPLMHSWRSPKMDLK